MSQEASNKVIDMEDSAPWYLVQCKPREGFRAADHLANQGFGCFHPTHSVKRRHAGKGWQRTESLFPWYLFVQIAPGQNFAKVKSTFGVARVVGFGADPLAVPARVVQAVIAQCRQLNDLPPEPDFKPGQNVTITEGCFKHIEAIVKATRGEDRAILLINLINQQQAIELPTTALKAL